MNTRFHVNAQNAHVCLYERTMDAHVYEHTMDALVYEHTMDACISWDSRVEL